MDASPNPGHPQRRKQTFAESDVNSSGLVELNENEERRTDIYKQKPSNAAISKNGIEDSKTQSMIKQKINKLTSFVSSNEDDCKHRIILGKSWESGLRFLVVDDTMTNRKMTVRMLSNFGHSVDQAIDGRDFLSKIAGDDDKYDVVLMDDNMPNMTGQEATAVARQQGYSGVIYGVTGNTSDDQVQSFLLSGADKVFAKPLNTDFLRTLICKNINS
jgi:CheY-like chemotaxis protein